MKQREIKFRAWDGQRIIVPALVFSDGESPLEVTSDVVDPKVNLKWMQFTGLLDKEGREIYEGDILEATRQTHEKQPLRDGNKYSKVVFEDGSFMASQSVQLNSKKIYTHGYVVIGNLYANPELLKETP